LLSHPPPPSRQEAADGVLSSQRVPYDLVRPVPPSTDVGFVKMIELGTALEMAAEGGWWEVEVLGPSGGYLAELVPSCSEMIKVPPAPRECDQELSSRCNCLPLAVP